MNACVQAVTNVAVGFSEADAARAGAILRNAKREFNFADFAKQVYVAPCPNPHCLHRDENGQKDGSASTCVIQ